MVQTNTPECCWDRCYVYTSCTRSNMALDIFDLHGETPQKMISGNTPDISYLAELGWYDWCWRIDKHSKTSMNVKMLGRYCGPSMTVGEPLCAAILKPTARYQHTTSYFPLSAEDYNSEAIQAQMKAFTEKLTESIKQRGKEGKVYKSEDSGDSGDSDAETEPEYYEPIDPDEEIEVKELLDPEEIEAEEGESFDKYISARVLVPRGEEMHYGTVLKCKRDKDGNLIGKSNENPFLGFEEGDVEAYTKYHC